VETAEQNIQTLGLLLSGSIALLVGLIDDFGVLTPSQKMLGQLLAALVLIKSGTYIKLTFLPIWVAIPLTIFWILAVTNAFNIIDIMDGLASGVAAVAAISIAAANHMAGRPSQAFLAVVLAGAAIGFLRHNFHPARIFLGDAGSMFVGFMLAALSMNAGFTRVNPLATISPVLILGIPLFDLLLVMFIRWRNGVPVTKGSPDHFALRLRRCNLSVRETAITTYIIAILLGVVALLMSNIRLEWAIVTMGSTMSLGCLSAYLLMKVNMRS
jgi:UDP-GlcNAc:undecaprenyl-phosphate GlcNAc-1-phosphate transferase